MKARLGTPTVELHAVHLINRRVFDRRARECELVEAFFDLCRGIPFVLFAIVMEHPTRLPSHVEPSRGYILPNQYRYLLQRINQYASESGQLATLLFDGDGPTLMNGTLPARFEGFLYRSTEGQSFSAITEAPFFVDSKITTGIQIADMAAAVIRIYQENELHRGFPVGDRFLSAVTRYYRIIEGKTLNLVTPEGYPRPGIYFMPERDHYSREVEQGMMAIENEPGPTEESPGSR